MFSLFLSLFCQSSNAGFCDGLVTGQSPDINGHSQVVVSQTSPQHSLESGTEWAKRVATAEALFRRKVFGKDQTAFAYQVVLGAREVPSVGVYVDAQNLSSNDGALRRAKIDREYRESGKLPVGLSAPEAGLVKRLLLRSPRFRFVSAEQLVDQLKTRPEKKRLYELRRTLKKMPPITFEEAITLVNALPEHDRPHGFSVILEKIFTPLEMYIFDHLIRILGNVTPGLRKQILRTTNFKLTPRMVSQLISERPDLLAIVQAQQWPMGFKIWKKLDQLSLRTNSIDIRIVPLLTRWIPRWRFRARANFIHALNSRGLIDLEGSNSEITLQMTIEAADRYPDLNFDKLLAAQGPAAVGTEEAIKAAIATRDTKVHNRIIETYFERNIESLTVADCVALAEGANLPEVTNRILSRFAEVRGHSMSVTEVEQIAEAMDEDVEPGRDQMFEAFSKQNQSRLPLGDHLKLAASADSTEVSDQILEGVSHKVSTVSEIETITKAIKNKEIKDRIVEHFIEKFRATLTRNDMENLFNCYGTTEILDREIRNFVERQSTLLPIAEVTALIQRIDNDDIKDEVATSYFNHEKSSLTLREVLNLVEDMGSYEASDLIIQQVLEDRAPNLVVSEVMNLLDEISDDDLHDANIKAFADTQASRLAVRVIVNLAVKTKSPEAHNEVLANYAQTQASTISPRDLNRIAKAAHDGETQDKIATDFMRSQINRLNPADAIIVADSARSANANKNIMQLYNKK